jgi:hypothetical protein
MSITASIAPLLDGDNAVQQLATDLCRHRRPPGGLTYSAAPRPHHHHRRPCIWLDGGHLALTPAHVDPRRSPGPQSRRLPMSFTFKPSTPPAGVQANDAAGQPESRHPIQQFKGGGTVHGGEFTRSVHASANSGQPVRLPPVHLRKRAADHRPKRQTAGPRDRRTGTDATGDRGDRSAARGAGGNRPWPASGRTQKFWAVPKKAHIAE